MTAGLRYHRPESPTDVVALLEEVRCHDQPPTIIGEARWLFQPSRMAS